MLEFMMIDAFTGRAFAGNPAAVVRGSPIDNDRLLQDIAMEFNQAETAFVALLGPDRYALRWFTPLAEVALCGHATLGAARALWDWGDVNADAPITFVTRRSGELICSPTADGRVALDFPATPPLAAPLPADAANVLGLADARLTCVGTTPMNLTIRLENERQVRAAAPNFRELARWHPVGVTITAPADDPTCDVVSRFFAPAVGIDEDPVTGSAHCTLAVYWSTEFGTSALRARQLSRRGGRLDVRLRGDRVELIGQAVRTMRGTVEADA